MLTVLNHYSRATTVIEKVKTVRILEWVSVPFVTYARFCVCTLDVQVTIGNARRAFVYVYVYTYVYKISTTVRKARSYYENALGFPTRAIQLR